MRPLPILICLGLLIVAPLVGVWIQGEDLGPYLEFPPLTRYVEHAAYSWSAFAAITILVTAACAPFLLRVLRHQHRVAPARLPRRPMPIWGWAGVLLTAIAWLIAWNRFEWFATWQPYTFSPIWFGYILVINGLTYRRSGRCMLRDQPRYLLALLLVSAAFWWFFEYLNRFVQNWYYVGIAELNAFEYFVYATLPFATVLPAVLGTRDFLATFPRLNAGLADTWVLRLPRGWARVGLLAAVAGLTCIGVWPDVLFPLLWVAPLVIIVAMQTLFAQPSILAAPARGDWREIWRVAMAALVCGFFWELWNFGSLAKWEYAVPLVQRFHLFEMPALGYAGYLPFGLECLVVGEIVRGWLARSQN